jgi:hypothetical protein
VHHRRGPEIDHSRGIRTSATTRRAVLRDDDCSAITNRTWITDGAPDTVMIGNTGVPDRS